MLIIYIVYKLRKPTAKPSDNRSAVDTATSVPADLPDDETSNAYDDVYYSTIPENPKQEENMHVHPYNQLSALEPNIANHIQ